MVEHIATEQRSLEAVLAELAESREHAAVLLSRLRRVVGLPEGALVLDVGAAAGSFVVACQELGYRCKGIEPWEQARLRAMALSRRLDVPIDILPGIAEDIPYPEDTFDLVHANSVLEHVGDLDRALAEAHRVLKPGGVFWFYSASAMCPVQGEIRGFPLFGWYPDWLKHKIMDWAKEKRPHLVGFTQTPAVNWFTPRKARAALQRHGFREICDRWDLREEQEGGKTYRAALCVVRLARMSRAMADMCVPDCSYAAIKRE